MRLLFHPAGRREAEKARGGRRAIALRKVMIVSVSEALARQRATTYLTQSGWQPVNGDADLTFRRGSLEGTLFSLSPLVWESTVSLAFTPEGTSLKMVAELQIGEPGRLSLPWNKSYWVGLLQTLESAVNGSPPAASKLKNLGPTSTLLNTLFGLAVGGLVGAGVIWFFWTFPLIVERVMGLRAVDVMAVLAVVLLVFSLMGLYYLNKRIRNKVGQR